MNIVIVPASVSRALRINSKASMNGIIVLMNRSAHLSNDSEERFINQKMKWKQKKVLPSRHLFLL